jgi:hypothetical protein
MISSHKERKIKRLLATGLSGRKIEKITGVSRGTICNIANGSRRIKKVIYDETIWDGCEKKRCPECGAKVFMPCLACAVRNGMKK